MHAPALRTLSILTLGVVTAPCALAACALSGQHADVEALIAVDKRQQAAYLTKDIAALDEIFTDDYVLVLSNGTERAKAEILKNAASDAARWEINETSGWSVRVHGDTAIVVATLHQKGIDHGTAFHSRVKFSDTYIRDNGRWRNVHAHASKSVPVE